ncbi:energy-coupling factor transporter transmembrane component T family protein [candidate division KSB1 bacterium]
MKESNKIISAFQSIDIRFKLIFNLLFLIFILSIRTFDLYEIIFYILILTIWAYLARPSFRTVLKRLMFAVPIIFVLGFTALFSSEGLSVFSFKILSINFSVTDTALHKFALQIIRVFLSLLSLIIFLSSENIVNVFHGMRKLGLPKIFVSAIFITFRYIDVIKLQAQKMVRAKKARSYNLTLKMNFKMSGILIGNLFLRSLRRSANVYNAMLARGFNGEFEFSDRNYGITLEHSDISIAFYKIAIFLVFVTLLILPKIKG